MVGCSMGLIEHYWYCWLDKMYTGRTMRTVLKKVVVDQLICAPSIGLWYFIGEKDLIYHLNHLTNTNICNGERYKQVIWHTAHTKCIKSQPPKCEAQWNLAFDSISRQGSHVTNMWRTTVSLPGMALTEGHTLSEGCMEFREKFWEYTMASICLSCRPTAADCKLPVRNQEFVSVP